MLWTCVPRLGQRVKVCTAHPTAGTRLDPRAEESRTPSTDTTGNSSRPEWLSDTTLGTTASSDRTHRRYFSPFGLAMPRPSETFCSGAIAKLRVLVAVDPARSRPRRRPQAMGSRGEAGKCSDRLPPREAMQLRAARLESSRELALDAIGAEEDDGTGAERRRKAEHGQTRSGTLS